MIGAVERGELGQPRSWVLGERVEVKSVDDFERKL
jgi:hypothetical protein